MRTSRIKHFLLLLLLFSLALIRAQPSQDLLLADQYFRNSEFEKALVHYEKAYNKQADYISYSGYLNCLLQLKDFKSAEKLVKKEIKRNNEDLKYMVELGGVYTAAEQTAKAREQFDDAIKQLKADQFQIINLAEAFIKIKEWDRAIAVYQKGRKLMNDGYPFNMELADVYERKGDLAAMTNEYLDLLLLGDGFLQSVQNALQIGTDEAADSKKYDILKSQLLKRVQQYPIQTTYSEMLAWLFMQQREFDAALTQLKAIDKRNNEGGRRVMELAQICVANEEYVVAEKSYKYVIEKGKEGYYYTNARMELIDCMKQKLLSKNIFSDDELVDLEKSYISTIDELGKSASTTPLVKGLAHLYAFYFHKTEQAIQLLQEVVKTPKLNPQVQADCKLELGDILLFTGDVWEASLTYSQVEKAFKYDQIGQEAKFRNAKISFYTGDFGWAQGQLDVLKGSTSKLIANDAMALSVLISDALGVDSVFEPLLMYARADLLFFQNKDNEALAVLDSISSVYPAHNLADDVLFKKYKIMLKKKKYDEASSYLKTITKNYSYDILADDALFYLAELNEFYLNEKQKAMEMYQDLLLKHPGSLYTVEARKRFRKLRGDTVY